MPHGGYSDQDIEEMYSMIDGVLDDARKKQRIVILGGDWNAEAGQRQPGEQDMSIGIHGAGSRNARGEVFVKWAALKRLVIMNSMFRKRFENAWTHTQAGRHRILDYFLVDVRYYKQVLDVGVLRELDLGSDHRSVLMRLRIQSNSSKKQRQPKRPGTKSKYWQPRDIAEYATELDDRLENEQLCSTLEARCNQIETVLADIAAKCSQALGQDASGNTELQRRLRVLISTRREQREIGTTESCKNVSDISKQIQKELRKSARERMHARIKQALQEFKNLKSISSIRSNGKKHFLRNVRNSAGNLVEDRQDIVDVFW